MRPSGMDIEELSSMVSGELSHASKITSDSTENVNFQYAFRCALRD